MVQHDNFRVSRRAFLTSSLAAMGCGAAISSHDLTTLASTSSSKLARSNRGMVTSPHNLASRAGIEVLAAGGTAIEAAIAMGAVLCVTYPHFSGLGGDAFFVLSDRQGNVKTLSGAGQAAQQLPNYSGSIPERGVGSTLTAGATVDTWGQAYEFSRRAWGGKRSWASLFQRAIEYAENGFPVTPSQRFWQEFRAKELSSWSDGFKRIFMPQGRMLDLGERLYQPALAKTLKTLAANGSRDFYEGELAIRIAAGLQQVGSPLTAADLARCRTRDEEPLRVAYRSGELIGLRPPTQGITTLEILGILHRFNLSQYPEGSVDYYHLLVEAVKYAFLDRDRYIADPDFVRVPTERLLSNTYLDTLSRRIDMAKALPWKKTFQSGDTVYLAAVDRQGNCVSGLQTIYFDWGSGVVVGDTGILWHNRGASFQLDADRPNALEPGKRPFHTLNPGMYLLNGQPHLLYGTQGADGQPQTLAALLTRAIDYQMNPLAALARPRFLLGKTFSDKRETLKLEKDAGEAAFKGLAARGHEIGSIAAQSPLAGHAGLIQIAADGSMTGAHDPRSDGRALGLSD